MMNKLGLVLALGCLVSGCSIESAVDVDDPQVGREIDNRELTTRSGALSVYSRAVGMLQDGVSQTSERVGLFTDELTNVPNDGLWLLGDARRESYRSDLTKGIEFEAGYTTLHGARVHARQARDILRKLNDASLTALIAGSYAIEGYAILLLAEDHCSGVPLTEVPFEGDIVYGDGLSTEQLFTVAVAKFDSALAVSHDSASIITLARIGKGRASLGLGNYEQAARAVADVAAADVFYLDYSQNLPPTPSPIPLFWTGGTYNHNLKAQLVEITNTEGVNGLTWFRDPTTVDPRVPVTTTIVNDAPAFPAQVRQLKFTGGTLRFPLARWIEAQMIRAEYALQQGDAGWITPINDARATLGLGPLTDPVARDARVTLLFQERAFWFYLEGVRLADYRRLVRQYRRSPHSVYPIGPYTRSRGDVPFYGEAWVFITPLTEDTRNFRYDGCIHTQP